MLPLPSRHSRAQDIQALTGKYYRMLRMREGTTVPQFLVWNVYFWQKLREMYSCPKQLKALDSSKTTVIAIFGCEGSKMLVKWEKPSRLLFQVFFLSTPEASCVSSETHEHWRANVGFDLTCLKNRPLLSINPRGKIVPLCCKRGTLHPLQKSNSPSLIQKWSNSCRAS